MNQDTSPLTTSNKIPVGISACLTGAPVRFNGGHKHSRFCTHVLSEYFDFRPTCPEVAIGLGTPREPIRLIGPSGSALDDTAIRAIGTDKPDLDVTHALHDQAQQVSEQMPELCGFIFMQKSPSCGVFDVKRYLDNGHPEGKARGVFAAEWMRRNPLLPVEEAGRLNDPALCENFMVRVFTYRDWQLLQQQPLTASALIAFHSRYKYLVMAHSVTKYRQLGRLLADLSDGSDAVAQRYITLLMEALAKPATRKLHTNVLMHLTGYLKRHIGRDDKQELEELILEYRRGIVPLVVPLTLLKHHLKRFAQACDYALRQVYLNPHPYELGLRNTL